MRANLLSRERSGPGAAALGATTSTLSALR